MDHKILLVDDDRDLLEMLCSIFRRAGYAELLTASSGGEALRIWREQNPDLLILDVRMPGMDGFAVLREIRRVSRVPVLMLNGGLPQQYELEFSEEHPGRAAQLFGDPALLRRMLDNLIRNSMVHNPQGCRISVTVSAGDGQAACTVADDGGGMEAAACEAMNQRQDVFPPRGSAGGGEHGMGLRLVRQIAQAHGGTVRFEPAEPHGLRVKITFPTGGAA